MPPANAKSLANPAKISEKNESVEEDRRNSKEEEKHQVLGKSSRNSTKSGDVPLL